MARRRNREGGREAEAEAECRGSGRYLVNDYSLARRRCQAWNTRSCLRCSACCCRSLLLPPDPGAGPGHSSAPYLSPLYTGNAVDGIARVSLQRGCKQFRPRSRAVSIAECYVECEGTEIRGFCDRLDPIWTLHSQL